MALELEEREWLEQVSGMALIQTSYAKQRDVKDVREEEMSVKLGLAKDSIRKEFAIKLKRKNGLGSIKVLEEEGTQLDEFDISDLNDFELKPDDLKRMESAYTKVHRLAAEMREATTEKIDEKTGKPVLDDEGKPILVPLYSEEEITEEVYMPLVRERIMPEELVPNKFSKTQEMIDASDKLYKERLAKYTKEVESDPDYSEDVKNFGAKFLDLGSKFAQMFPGGDMASTCLQLAEIGFTTSVTMYQMIGAEEWQGMADTVVDNIGQIVSGVVSAVAGSNLGNTVQEAYSAAVAIPKMAIDLSKDPPDLKAVIADLSSGVSAAFSVGVKNPSEADKVIQTALLDAIKNAGNALDIRDAVAKGDRKAAITAFGKMAQQIAQDTSSIIQDVSKDNPQKVQDITKRITEGLQLAEAGLELASDVVDDKKKKKVGQMVQDIVDGFGKILNDAVGDFAPPDVAKSVGTAYSAATSTGKVIFFLARKKPDAAKALTELAKGITGSLELACGDSATAGKIGKIIETALQSAAGSIDIAKAIEEEKYSDAIQKLNKVADAVIKAALGKSGGTGTGGGSGGDDGGDITGALDKVSSGLSDMANEIQEFRKSIKDLDASEIEAKVMEVRGQKALEEISESEEDMRRMLVQRNDSGKVAAEERSIDNLIKQMVKDRMIMELATKLASGGIGVVSKFVPGLGAADAAIQLATNLIKAAQRAMELNKWIGNQKDMSNAQSSFTSSAQNFVKNQAEQFSHYAIQSALKLAQMIGEIVKCSGIASAAGEGLSKGAVLAAEAEEQLYAMAKKINVELAWRSTRKAWDHPESRKLQLVARKMNPTLAKYTFAWGAVVKHDPLAMEAMSTCGINELTLSDPKSNVDKVQQYLETMFNEDNVVLRRVVAPDWMPAAVELTARSWATAKAKAIKVAELVETPTGAIDESMAQIETLSAAVETLENKFEHDRGPAKNDLLPELQEQRQALIEALVACQEALGKYTPRKGKKGEGTAIHDDMAGLIKDYSDMAGTRQAEVEAALAETDELLDTVSFNKMFA